MQAGHASIPARAARGSGGGGRGLKRKLELRPKRHALIFGGIPSCCRECLGALLRCVNICMYRAHIAWKFKVKFIEYFRGYAYPFHRTGAFEPALCLSIAMMW